jgi:hypothetical protein
MKLPRYDVPINIYISAAFVLAERITRISSTFGDEIFIWNTLNVQEAPKEIEHRISLWKVPLVVSNATGTAILHSEERNLSYGNSASSAAQLRVQLLFASLSDMIRVSMCNCKLNFLSREVKSYEKIINVTTSSQNTRSLL